MIRKANRNGRGHSEARGESWRIVNGQVIRGTDKNVTYYQGDIVEIPIYMIEGEEPTIDQLKTKLKGKISKEELSKEEEEILDSTFPEWEIGKILKDTQLNEAGK